jgi:hypothetical protein
MGDTGLTLARVGVAHVCARARACPCLCAGDLSFVRA